MTATTTAPRTRRRTVVASAAVALVVIALLAAASLSWWSRPDAFGGWDESYSWSGETQVGRTMNVGLTAGAEPDGPITTRRIRPVVPVNTADADIELVVCTRGAGGTTLGSSSEPLPDAETCPEVRPLDDAGDVDWSSETVVARVTPRRAGVVQLAGVEVTYTRDAKHLWQSGSERAGGGSRLTVP